MKLLKTYDKSDAGLANYTDRNTARCVILDKEQNKILLFGGFLVGGKVEDGESDEEAIAREALEEIGAELEIIRPLGEIIAYRKALKMRYLLRGYECKYVRKISEPTTTIELEKNMKAEWFDIEGIIPKLEKYIEDQIKQDPKSFEEDKYHTQIRNRQVNLDLIKEALKN